MIRRAVLLAAAAATAFAVLVAGSALTGSNTVPSTRVGQNGQGIGVNDLKPPACAALTLASVVSGSGTINGTGANELVVGGPGPDTINGGAGTDCILGGGGDDTINGGDGNDICIGGSGTDTFVVFILFPTCETAIQ